MFSLSSLLIAALFQDGGKEQGAAASPGGKRKGTKVVSALQESLAQSKGGEGAANGKGATVAVFGSTTSGSSGSSRPYSGRAGRGSGGNSNNMNSRRSYGEGADASGQWTRRDANSAAGAANAGNSGSAAGTSGSSQNEGGRGEGGRGGRGGRGRGNRGASSGFNRSSQPQMSSSLAPFVGYYGGHNMQGVYYPPTAYNAAAATGAPAMGMVTKQMTMESVRKQIDYYFSLDNLCKDIFLRSKMDAEGWIPLAVVANFNRVRMLTPDLMLIVEAVRDSDLVEVSKDSAFLRAKGTWEKWILPPQQRDLSHSPAAAAAAAANASSTGAGDQSSPESKPADSKPADGSPSKAAAITSHPIPALSRGRPSDAKDDEDEDEEDDDLFEMDEVQTGI